MFCPRLYTLARVLSPSSVLDIWLRVDAFGPRGEQLQPRPQMHTAAAQCQRFALCSVLCCSCNHCTTRVCWKEAEAFCFPSSQMLNVFAPSQFPVIWLSSLGDVALKDITGPMKSSEDLSRCHNVSVSLVVFDIFQRMIFPLLILKSMGITQHMICTWFLISEVLYAVQRLLWIEAKQSKTSG